MDIILKYFHNLTEEQVNKFRMLDELYHDWNAKINVISRKDIDNLYEHHVLHSMGIAELIRFKPGTKVMDLGTGGGLRLLEGKYDNTFFVSNCDIIIEEDYGKIVKYHKEHHNIITMVCAMKNVVIPYGTIQMSDDGNVLSLEEKPIN